MVEEFKRRIISNNDSLLAYILTWMEVDADKTESRWNEIRDGMLNSLSLSLNNDELNRFNMRLSRALQRLEKEGLVVKTSSGHKKTAYSLKKPLVSSIRSELPGWRRFYFSLRWYEVNLPNDFALFKIAKQSGDYVEFKEKTLAVISEKIEDELREKWEYVQENQGIFEMLEYKSIYEIKPLVTYYKIAHKETPSNREV